MENYRIHYSDKTRDIVLETIERFSNNILINNISGDSIGVTIESDDAGTLYGRLLDEINRQVKTAEENSGREIL